VSVRCGTTPGYQARSRSRLVIDLAVEGDLISRVSALHGAVGRRPRGRGCSAAGVPGGHPEGSSRAPASPVLVALRSTSPPAATARRVPEYPGDPAISRPPSFGHEVVVPRPVVSARPVRLDGIDDVAPCQDGLQGPRTDQDAVPRVRKSRLGPRNPPRRRRSSTPGEHGVLRVCSAACGPGCGWRGSHHSAWSSGDAARPQHPVGLANKIGVPFHVFEDPRQPRRNRRSHRQRRPGHVIKRIASTLLRRAYVVSTISVSPVKLPLDFRLSG